MLTESQITNRMVSGREAAKMAGLRPGTVSKLKHDGDFAPDCYRMGEVLSLRVAEKLYANGVELRIAAQVAATITADRWQEIARMSRDTEVFLTARCDRDSGQWQVEVVEAEGLASLATYNPLVVSLTQLWLDTDTDTKGSANQ